MVLVQTRHQKSVRKPISPFAKILVPSVVVAIRTDVPISRLTRNPYLMVRGVESKQIRLVRKADVLSGRR